MKHLEEIRLNDLISTMTDNEKDLSLYLIGDVIKDSTYSKDLHKLYSDRMRVIEQYLNGGG